MKLTYSLNVNDFLQYQLYTASRNRIIKNQRLRGYIFFILFLITLSFISFSDYEKPTFFVTLLIAAVLLCIYPIYVRRYYYNHNKKSANENFKNKAEKKEIYQSMMIIFFSGTKLEKLKLIILI